ncbi:MAG: flagellar protein FlaG [Gammaproteobacteria bacterium]|jgi:flagellar protein FlaG
MSVPKIADAPPAAVTAQRAADKAAAAQASATQAADQRTNVRRAVEADNLAADERARIAERLQQMARESGRQLEFRVDEASDKMVIVVRDQSTGELIRQIPDATALRIAQRLESQVEAMRSVLFEGRV